MDRFTEVYVMFQHVSRPHRWSSYFLEVSRLEDTSFGEERSTCSAVVDGIVFYCSIASVVSLNCSILLKQSNLSGR